MAPDRKKNSLGLLLLITGYLESFKFVVFYAFNLEPFRFGIIISMAVVAYFFVIPFMKTGFTRFLPGFLLFLTILIASSQASSSFLYSAATCIYGLMVVLIAGFILERNSAREIFILGGLFEAAAIFTSDRGILGYIIINLVFTLALNIQLYISGIEIDPRIRFTDGSGIRKNLISTAALIILLSVGTVLTLYLKDDLVTGNYRPLTFLSQERVSGYINDGFWDKLRSFEFKGQVPVDDTPVMLVKSPVPSYWRGETADFYTGRGWKNSMLVRTAGDKDFGNPLPENVPVRKISQIFSYYPGQGSQTVYSGGATTGISEVAVQSPNGQPESLRLLTDEGGNIYFPKFKPGRAYHVVAYIPETEGRLPEHNPKARIQSPSGVNPKYLQLPEISARVKSLSESLTQSATGPYAKARKIERFLSTNYPYDLTVEPLPEGRELTEFFLFDLKAGYCTYHSTAMVVMLRSIGIPARWVTGFTTGNYMPEQGAYEVKQSDAHAWVEAYIDGFGWVSFEPTAGFTISAAEGTSSAPVSLRTGYESKRPVMKQVTDKKTGPSFPVEPGLLLITVAALTLLIMKVRTGTRHIGGTEYFYKEFLQLMARRGYYKDAVQTPYEFAVQLKRTGQFDGIFTEIMRITRAYEKHRFSPVPLEPWEEEEITAILNRLVLRLK